MRWVRLIADHWNIRYDADDTDLSTLNEETLNVKATASSPTSKRVSIAQVLEARLLIAGETLDMGASPQGRTLGSDPSLRRQAAHG